MIVIWYLFIDLLIYSLLVYGQTFTTFKNPLGLSQILNVKTQREPICLMFLQREQWFCNMQRDLIVLQREQSCCNMQRDLIVLQREQS